MKKFLFLLLGCFSLMYAQLGEYFVGKPTQKMVFVLESIQRIEQEIQNLCKIFKERFKELPDSFLYIPHSFTRAASWDDFRNALQEAQDHLSSARLFVNEIDEYKSYEHPAVSVYNYNEEKWFKEIGKLLALIDEFQRKGIPERERYYSRSVPVSSSIYHPSVYHVVRTRWQRQRPTQPRVIVAEQRLSELD